MHDGPRSWIFFPDFTAGSPYQDCLADALAPQGWKAFAGDIAAAVVAGTQGPTVFHLGWEQPVYIGAKVAAEAFALAEAFFGDLDRFLAAGGVLAWTIHNLKPHEERFPAVNAFMQQGLAQRADLVHVHNRTGAAHALAMGARPGAVVLARHPSYAEAYPDDITDAAARRYLRLAPEAVVFSFFGAMRGYKGLPRLMRAFDAASVAFPKARLVVAGRASPPSPMRFAMPNPRLRVLARDIADAEVQYVIRAADCVVLPYEAVLTSGVLALAHGFGRPVIVPDLPSMVEEVVDGVDGFIFKCGSDDALRNSFRRAADALGDVRGRMRVAARATVEGRDFASLAAALALGVECRFPLHRAA